MAEGQFPSRHSELVSESISVNGLKSKRKIAFTLAEVLITLGIIGVVAALTLPTLLANQRKKEVTTKLKKVYTVMNQAINLSVVEYGDVTQLGEQGECGVISGESCSSAEETERIFNKYIGKHLQNIKIEPKGEDTAAIVVYFPDGTILRVAEYIKDMSFFINKKALENPRPGVNQFNFRFSPIKGSGVNAELWNKPHVGKGFEPYAYAWDGTLNGLLHNAHNYGCGDDLNAYCTKLIQLNGWEIPDDYPFKF